MSITQQALIAADPARVYAMLADAAALSALSGMGEVPAAPAARDHVVTLRRLRQYSQSARTAGPERLAAGLPCVRTCGRLVQKNAIPVGPQGKCLGIPVDGHAHY